MKSERLINGSTLERKFLGSVIFGVEDIPVEEGVGCPSENDTVSTNGESASASICKCKVKRC
jgi:hypothetical protein